MNENNNINILKIPLLEMYFELKLPSRFINYLVTKMNFAQMNGCSNSRLVTIFDRKKITEQPVNPIKVSGLKKLWKKFDELRKDIIQKMCLIWMKHGIFGRQLLTLAWIPNAWLGQSRIRLKIMAALMCNADKLQKLDI